MAIWKLEPVEPGDYNWRASQYVGPVFARAQDETDARGLASDAFGIAAGKLPGMGIPITPWRYDWLVTCELIEETEFDEEGPDTILGPKKALARAHPS